MTWTLPRSNKMQKPLTYALLLAATLGLAACGDKPEEKKAAEVREQAADVAKEASSAVEQKAEEVREQAAETAKEASSAVEQKAEEVREDVEKKQ
ncbi:hypothetical protein D3C78_871250 [compost metagenome]